VILAPFKKANKNQSRLGPEGTLKKIIDDMANGIFGDGKP